MAKKKVNISQAVRDYLDQSPKATPAVIQEDLRKQGIEASYSLISQVKYKKAAGGGKRRKRANGRSASPSFSINELVQAKEIANRMGGLDRAKELLHALGKII